jgi:serine/threonine-protein kinase PknK
MTARRVSLAAAALALAFASAGGAGAQAPLPGPGTAPLIGGTAAPSGNGWFPLHPSNDERQEVVSARIGQYIYLAGGFDLRTGASRVLERYDTSADQWSELAPLPLALHHSAAVAYHGALYVVGGYAADQQGFERSDGLALAILLKYRPKTDTWTELPAPPTKRGAFAVGVIGGKLYVAGGNNVTEGELARLEIYDFHTRHWSRGPDMGLAREHIAGAVSDGKLYVIGGRTDSAYLLGNVARVDRYDPVTREWQRVSDLLHARSGASAVNVDGDLVVFGGEEREGDGVIEQVERYHPATDTWTPLPDMLTPRHSMGAASLDRRVYALEGADIPRIGISNVAEALDVPR